jgi:hypothetical protein
MLKRTGSESGKMGLAQCRQEERRGPEDHIGRKAFPFLHFLQALQHPFSILTYPTMWRDEREGFRITSLLNTAMALKDPLTKVRE